MNKVKIAQGWSSEQKIRIAELYEQAFGSKFEVAINRKQQRVNVLANGFVDEFSFIAEVEAKIVGLAGFQTPAGSLTGGISLKSLVNELGFIRGWWAVLVFSLFERKAEPKELVMDGIVVDADYRSQGIGGLLLDTILEYAKANDFETVRLDVIDSNPRAKKLYEKKGFVATKTDYFPYLKWLIGFSGSTTMVYVV